MTNKQQAYINAIAEGVISKMQFDEELGFYIFPEGAIFSVDKQIFEQAADALKMKQCLK